MKNLKWKRKRLGKIIFPESYVMEHFYYDGEFLPSIPENINSCSAWVSLGTLGHLSASHVHALYQSGFPSINIMCYEMKLQPKAAYNFASTEAQAVLGVGAAPSARYDQTSLHVEFFVQRTNTGVGRVPGIHWQKRAEDKRATPAWLSESPQSP